MSGPMKRASCHCGAVELSLKLPDPLETCRCDCSLCARKSAVMLTVPLADLTVTKGADKLSLYSFNTHTAKHYFCSICGIYTHHQRRSNPNEYGVNIGCIEGLDIKAITNAAPWVDGQNHPSDD